MRRHTPTDKWLSRTWQLVVDHSRPCPTILSMLYGAAHCCRPIVEHHDSHILGIMASYPRSETVICSVGVFQMSLWQIDIRLQFQHLFQFRARLWLQPRAHFQLIAFRTMQRPPTRRSTYLRVVHTFVCTVRRFRVIGAVPWSASPTYQVCSFMFGGCASVI